MKGMFDLLERAGLVSRVEGAGASQSAADAPSNASPATQPSSVDASPPVEQTTAMTLEQVYAVAGVQPCAYPAERLLRLIDGLKAMDDTTRRQTIQAIDAADDTWSIDDPRRDAAAKVAAIERHAASIRAGVTQDHQETQARLQDVGQRQEATVSEVRRQIADLDGLLAREIARGAQETAALNAALQSRREGANRELANLARIAQALTSLIAQFDPNTTK